MNQQMWHSTAYSETKAHGSVKYTFLLNVIQLGELAD